MLLRKKSENVWEIARERGNWRFKFDWKWSLKFRGILDMPLPTLSVSVPACYKVYFPVLSLFMESPQTFRIRPEMTLQWSMFRRHTRYVLIGVLGTVSAPNSAWKLFRLLSYSMLKRILQIRYMQYLPLQNHRWLSSRSATVLSRTLLWTRTHWSTHWSCWVLVALSSLYSVHVLVVRLINLKTTALTKSFGRHETKHVWNLSYVTR